MIATIPTLTPPLLVELDPDVGVLQFAELCGWHGLRLVPVRPGRWRVMPISKAAAPGAPRYVAEGGCNE